jgi:hypothetical protein
MRCRAKDFFSSHTTSSFSPRNGRSPLLYPGNSKNTDLTGVALWGPLDWAYTKTGDQKLAKKWAPHMLETVETAKVFAMNCEA